MFLEIIVTGEGLDPQRISSPGQTLMMGGNCVISFSARFNASSFEIPHFAASSQLGQIYLQLKSNFNKLPHRGHLSVFIVLFLVQLPRPFVHHVSCGTSVFEYDSHGNRVFAHNGSTYSMIQVIEVDNLISGMHPHSGWELVDKFFSGLPHFFRVRFERSPFAPGTAYRTKFACGILEFF